MWLRWRKTGSGQGETGVAEGRGKRGGLQERERGAKKRLPKEKGCLTLHGCRIAHVPSPKQKWMCEQYIVRWQRRTMLVLKSVAKRVAVVAEQQEAEKEHKKQKKRRRGRESRPSCNRILCFLAQRADREVHLTSRALAHPFLILSPSFLRHMECMKTQSLHSLEMTATHRSACSRNEYVIYVLWVQPKQRLRVSNQFVVVLELRANEQWSVVMNESSLHRPQDPCDEE